MTEIARRELEKIVRYDHQGRAQELMRSSPSGVTQRLSAYELFIREVAKTDIQSWARKALKELEDDLNWEEVLQDAQDAVDEAYHN